VNHSHFSQFMNLSIGAALGLMLARLHEEFAGQPLRLPGLIARLGEAELRPVWYLGGMIVLGAITIFISLSRGGMIALLIAGAFTALMIASKRSLKGRGWIMFCVALAAFVCVLYVGFDAVYERMATLQQLNEYKSRWQILSDLTVSVTRFPSVGTGLGTHEVVYPMFDRSTIPDLAAHAENEYAQVAEETGIAGLTIVLLFLGIVGWSYARCVRRIRIPIRSAAFGLGLGLLAILIQSLSDFGQHLPANACLTAVTCALLIRLRRMVRSSSSAKSDYGFITRLWPLRAVAAVAVVGVWAWALVGANAARSAEASWSDAVQVEAQIRNQQWLASNEAYAALLEPAVAATEAEPDNVKYRHWLNVYRWNAIRRVRDPRTGLVILTPETRDFSEQIVDNLNQARTLCPTFGATYCVAGQIEKFVLDEPIGADHIRTGYRLAPCDATACFAAGMLDVVEGKPEASVDKFQRSRKLDSGFATDIIDVYLLQAKRPDLAMAFAEDDIRCLFQVADRLQNGAEDCDLATTVREKAVAMLKADCERDDVPSWELAMMANSCFQDDNYDEAVKWYRRALISDYDQVGWRINLAQALVKIGQPEDAMREARICLRLSPKMGAAKKLIGDLSLSMRPAATGSEK
jgi:tetratricopeptide (TPR) repeat protein